MENNNTEENSKDQSVNFSPTEAYQYEETKTVEPNPPPPEVQEFDPDLQSGEKPLIADETNVQGSESEPGPVPELPRPREIRPSAEDESTITYEVNPGAPNVENVRNPNDPNLDAEFYQHSLQYLVQNLNNLRDTLQTIITSNEINQEIGAANQPAINQRAENGLQAGILNNENQITDQLLNLRRILSGNMENNNPQNNPFGWAPNNQAVPNNPENANSLVTRFTNWSNNLEASARQFISTIPKDANTFSWIIFFISIALFIIGYSTVPDLQQKDPEYFIDWLAYHKSSRFFLLVSIYKIIVLILNRVLLYCTLVSLSNSVI